MPREYIASTVESELRRLPAYEEGAEIGPQNADAMRFHAAGLRARCRYVEDKPHPDDLMVTISVRWARVIARALDEGADARELFDA